MDRYYVELTAAQHGIIPLAVEANTAADGKERASKRFNMQFHARYAEVLSAPASKLFTKVDHWPEDEELISPEIFRTTVATLLKEGFAIADKQWQERRYSLVSPKAEYVGATIDEMALLMHCIPEEINGVELYPFNKQEALMFMAIIIREGIARRLRALVQGN